MGSLLKEMLFLLTYKYIDEDTINAFHIQLHEKELSYFNLSTNLIISFEYNENVYYFRECEELCDFDEYFKKAINRFFKIINNTNIDRANFKQDIPIVINFSKEEIIHFYQYINDLYQNKAFIRILPKIDRIAYEIGFSIWENKEYDANFFSLFKLINLPSHCYNIAIYFLWYMKGVASRYRKLFIIRGKKRSYFFATKAIASSIFAKEIGLQDMITPSNFCFLELDDGTNLFGVLSPAAIGNRMIDKQCELNGSLQKELINLNVLDILCFQPDHGPNNYNVFLDDNKRYRICAFDNDNPTTFFPLPSISYRFNGCEPFVNKFGNIRRPFLDKQIVDNIMALDCKGLFAKLKPYLNIIQLFSLYIRILKFKRAVNKNVFKQSISLLNEIEWDQDTINEELCGLYGVTYLHRVLK